MSRKGTYQVVLDSKTAADIEKIAAEEQRSMSNTLALLIKESLRTRKQKNTVTLLSAMKVNEG
jgi:hypothetical protein